MSEMKIRVWAKGNPGNIAMMYLTAMTLQNQVGRGEICNVGLPIFGIDIPDVNLSKKSASMTLNPPTEKSADASPSMG